MNSSIIYLSSITKKIFVALFGAFLLTFCVVHLCINLTLLRDDNGEWFKAAVGFMTTNYIVKAFEIVLLGTFLLHMLLAAIVTLQNWMSRPVRYKVSNKAGTSFFSRYMIWTGLIILTFIVIHFMNFYLVKLGLVNPIQEGIEIEDFYSMVPLVFQIPAYFWIYIVLILGLGFHLYHAVQSAFQTLGLSHNKYTPAVKCFAACYAVIMTIGFMVIPIYFHFFNCCNV